jgi:hypothetical protein
MVRGRVQEPRSWLGPLAFDERTSARRAPQDSGRVIGEHQAVRHPGLKIFQHGGFTRRHRDDTQLSIRLPELKPIGAIGRRAEGFNLVLGRRHLGSTHVLIWFRRILISSEQFDTDAASN